MAKLIFDIETIGDDFDNLDDYAKDSLLEDVRKNLQNGDEYQDAFEDLKNRLGLSPLTGQIVCIGVLDYDKNKGAVYYQNPKDPSEEFEENEFKFKALSEKEMLQKFWDFAQTYSEFISFNGRRFDAPFLIIRSAVNQVRCSCNLMHYKYSLSQRDGPTHIDLYDQLTFHREFFAKGFNLHMFCRAFGIESPKINGVDGKDVTKLFKEGKFLEIARYNVWDLRATKELYRYWNEYIRPYM